MPSLDHTFNRESEGRGQALVPWLPALIALAGLILMRNPSDWIGLTVAGLGMGMILFMASCGLNLVFGLMGVMNFGHGIFMTLGGFLGALMIALANGWLSVSFKPDNPMLTLLVLLYATICVMLASLPFGWIFERLLIRPAGKDTTKQVMLTAAGAVVFSEICVALIGMGTYVSTIPGLTGSLIVGGIHFEKMRLVMIVIGLIVWLVLVFVLDRTRLGLLIRATVENRELVEASGYRTRDLINCVFVLGCGLAAIGGLIWGMYQQTISVTLGGHLLPYLLMILMIGGMGSITGTLIAALMVGLVNNYIGYAYPAISAFSCVFLTLAVLAWRPQGLYHRHISHFGNAPILGADNVLSNRFVDKFVALIAAIPFAYLLWLTLQRSTLPVESILFVINLGTITVTMLLRHPPKRVTQNPLFWFLAFLASYWQFFTIMLYQPGERLVAEFISQGVVVFGILVVIWARFSLGRNIGLVPAEREIVSSGPYRFVRHPIYTGIFLTVLGMTLAEYSPRNALLNLILVGLFCYKSIVEENFLKLSEPYAAYMKNVRWRWLPFIV